MSNVLGMIPIQSKDITNVGIRKANNGYIVEYYDIKTGIGQVMLFLDLDAALIHIQSIF